MSARGRVSSLRGAASFVDRVGIALAFPKDDIVLPSLWQAVAGTLSVDWAVRDEEGRFVAFTPEFDRLWRWKDELPAKRLACAGKHLRGRSSFVSLELLDAVYALTGRSGRAEDFRDEKLDPVARDVAEAVLECGPCTHAELHDLVGAHDRKRIDAATTTLQRILVVTGAGVERRDHGWPAVLVDTLARRYADRLADLPPPDRARERIASKLLAAVGEVSAADVTGALGWRKREAIAALEALADRGEATTRDDGGIRLWSPRIRRTSAVAR